MSHCAESGIYIPLSDGRLCPVEVVTLIRLPGDLSEAEVRYLAGYEEDEPPMIKRVVYGPGTVLESKWEQVEVEGVKYWEIVVQESEE